MLTTDLRRQLERTVMRARVAAEQGARAALDALAVSSERAHATMTDEQRELRRRLRAHARQLGDRRQSDGVQETPRLLEACAYEHWHRMLFARFLAENQLLLEPEWGVPITLEECRDLAREQHDDPWQLAGRFAARMLPEIFRPDDPVLQLRLPREHLQELEQLLNDLPPAVFQSDDALGWTYQFWQTEEKNRVNAGRKSGAKVAGDDLAAVTQLFTEDYMVKFLLHNTLGAWYAGRVLADHPDWGALESEEAVRTRIAPAGYSLAYLRLVRETSDGKSEWRPAAGPMAGWPDHVGLLKVLDPCCGSGHFLVEALDLLLHMRMALENLSAQEALAAVVADNLFGLELDPRCTQIAAFNLALTAWKRGGGHFPLPPLNIACSGLSTASSREEWVAWAGGDRMLQYGLDHLHQWFAQAPELGSLINPHGMLDSSQDLFAPHLGDLPDLLRSALAQSDPERAEPERAAMGVAAQGMVKAAELLMGQYTLVATNVPYLARGQQAEPLRRFCMEHYADAKGDLATVFLMRCLAFCRAGGTVASVLPDKWMSLTTYTKLRKTLLRDYRWRFLARLGEGGFESSAAAGAFTVLLGLDRQAPALNAGDDALVALDASQEKTPGAKAEAIRMGALSVMHQGEQLRDTDAIISVAPLTHAQPLSERAGSRAGLQSGDRPRMNFAFWEVTRRGTTWKMLQGTVDGSELYGGNHYVLRWCDGKGVFRELVGARLDGVNVWGHQGVVVSLMRDLPVSLYSGEAFDNNTAVIVPHSDADLAAIWCFCSAPEFHELVRQRDQKLNVTNGTLVKVPFDIDRWRAVAAERYPDGLPDPYTEDPTQWIFHGHPAAAAHPLQVVVMRLLGYRWPAEEDTSLRLSATGRDWVEACGRLTRVTAETGVVVLSAVPGQRPAVDQLRGLLAEAFGDRWSRAQEEALLAAEGVPGGVSLEDWLRDEFFQAHCRVFQQRPIVWHIWDGRRDGFHALVNYHRLVARGGDGRRLLENLTYTHLAHWIERQRREQREGAEGADGRLAAAATLQERLKDILQGDPPYDLFVRWKPLSQQPVGWEPDGDDGVRINIRPFLAAPGSKASGLLRVRPRITWGEDRGQELMKFRPQDQFPWCWGLPEDGAVDFMGGPAFAGKRRNDLHYTRQVKQEARRRAGERSQ